MSIAKSSVEFVASQTNQLHETLCRVIQGKNDVIRNLITAVFAGGSVLLEDVPGVGKTTLARALAMALGLEFRRIQSTPDLLPADIFGVSIYDPRDQSFRFRKGPVFCNLLLMDEINRASPRTQSALLEAMAEQQVTVDGECHSLRDPFLVIATQNPSGFHGTFPLPESQLDRFLFRLSIDYPTAQGEVDMLFNQLQSHPLGATEAVMGPDDLVSIQQRTRQVHVGKDVAQYVVAIANLTRNRDRFQLGCSPRGSLSLLRASQAAAIVDGRDFVLPDDVQHVAPLVLNHRLVAVGGGLHTDMIHQTNAISELISELPVPV